jgi:Mce-associated membrane protein
MAHTLQQAQSAAAEGNLALGRSAVEAAKSYAVEFGSYDYRHLDADFAKVAAHLTPEFKKSYIESSSRLKPAIAQVKGVAVGTVRAAGLVSATATTAVVAVFLDQKVTTSQSKTPRIDRNRLLVTMERSGSTWLISKLTSP